ncbi:hypothetical protein HUJ04_011214 [Dendroctonus ponderosae]|nr:hypothetical protein HUJ04_011214 [Dendroctonus ponderosae]
MASLTTDEFVRRLEAMEAKLERSAEEAAPPTASKGDSGESTDSSDGEGFKSPNRRRKRKRIGPTSSSEEDKLTKKCALSTGSKPQPRDPRKTAQPAQQSRRDAKKKQAAPAAQQLDDEVLKKQATPAAQQTSTRRTKIPPIVLREKSKYDEITRKLMDSKVNYGCGITTKEGVRTHPPTENDYRMMIRILDNNKYQYHTFQLEEEKQLRVVIRAFTPSQDPCNEMMNDIVNAKTPGGLPNFDGDSILLFVKENQAETSSFSSTANIQTEGGQVPKVLQSDQLSEKNGSWCKRRPGAVRTLHTNQLASKYEVVADLKSKFIMSEMKAADRKREREEEEHALKVKSLQIDIALKKAQLKKINDSE